MNFIPISKPSITQKEMNYVNDAMQSGWVSSLGSYIDVFEKKFADYCGVKYAVSTSSGTTALHLTLAAYRIKEGDEVIVPDLTFIATANAVKYVGASVVTVDVSRDTFCIDIDKVKGAITNKTKAIIPVHLYGHPAPMREINDLAKLHNLIVIEDAAEAHGAEVDLKKVGGIGDAGIFSFYGNKIITSGEGGMVTTNDEGIYNRLKLLRDHAMSKDKRYWHDEVGFNYRMTNLQAALGLAQLERIDEILEKKKKIFDWYSHFLKDVENIQLNTQKENYKNSYWMVCLVVERYSEDQRNSLIKNLEKINIDCRPFFYPVSKMPMYRSHHTKNTYFLSGAGLNLPSFYDITKKEVLYICQELKKILT